MGTSSGLIHHYFASMDELLAEAFEQVAAAELARDGGGADAVDGPSRAVGGLLLQLHPSRRGLGDAAVARRVGRGRAASSAAADLAAAERGVATVGRRR